MNLIRDTITAFFRPSLIWRNLGSTLLVGEGNLSFSVSLILNSFFEIEDLTATTYEKSSELSNDTMHNANILKSCAVRVFHGVNAKKLYEKLNGNKFDTIIFQFPNAASRSPKYGRNENHILIREFLRSASEHLKESGKVMISAVNSPYYEGVFNFEEAANFAGYKKPEMYDFDPKVFKEYKHQNTNDDESAAQKYRNFCTWVFRLK